MGHRERVNSGRVYVPSHSHIYTKDGTPQDLAVTLSIHNVSIERELVIDEVKYYGTSGKLLEEYLAKPIVLAPLQTVEYFVPIQDRRGGSGANFVVGWHADSPVVRPLVEAVMVHTQGPQGFAFVSTGIEIPLDAELPKEEAQEDAGDGEPATPEPAQPEPAQAKPTEPEPADSADAADPGAAEGEK